MRILKLALWAFVTLALLVVAVALIGQNTQSVEIALFRYTSPSYPLWAVLLGAMFFGALLASVFFLVELIVLETRNIRLRRSNAKLQRALSLAAPAAKTTEEVKPNGSAGADPRIGPSVGIDEDV